MRTRSILFLAAATLVLTACTPLLKLPDAVPGPTETQPTVDTGTTLPIPVELPIEIEESSSSVTSTGALLERLGEHGVLEVGEAAAPHTLTVFTNFACAYCDQFAREILPALEQGPVREGKLKITFVVTPLRKYPNSTIDAAALLCATALGHGEEMRAKLTEVVAHDRAAILALGKKLFLPVKEFTRCLSAKDTMTLIAQQKEIITAQNVTLIPTFVLDGDVVTGLPSTADFNGWMREKLGQ